MREGGLLVAQLHQLGGRVFARLLKRRGLADLNPAQGRVLYALWRSDGMNQKRLAELTRLDKSTLTAMLDRLEADGRIERRPDPADGRGRLVCPTAATRALYADYAAASEEMTEIFYAGLPEADRDELDRLLRAALANLASREAAEQV
jgi:DNA-binding MarR family transcriptional regulator